MCKEPGCTDRNRDLLRYKPVVVLLPNDWWVVFAPPDERASGPPLSRSKTPRGIYLMW